MSSGTAVAATTASSKSSPSHTTNGTGATADELVPAAMSTSALEAKLKQLREKSNKHSQLLTAKLASSQSGQNLLHIGTSLSTLPPDLHSLLTQLHPVLSSAETTEKVHHEHLTKLVECGNAIRQEQRRVVYTEDAADLYEDLVAAEHVVQIDIKTREQERRQKQQQHQHHHGNNNMATSSGSVASKSTAASSSRRQYSFDSVNHNDDTEDDEDDNDHRRDEDDDQKRRDEKASTDKLDHVSSLERCAQTTLILVKDLQASTDVVAALTASKVSGSTSSHHHQQPKDVSASTTGGAAASGESKTSNNNTSNGTSTAMVPSMRTPLNDDTERAQFLMKLAPRIRRLESGTINSLTYQMEQILQSIQENRRRKMEREEEAAAADNNGSSPDGNINNDGGMNESDLLLMMGHCMRGLALLGRGKEVENIFARVAIMPLIRSKLSMGRLDEGGPRGECTGLKSLLEDIIVTIGQTFGSVIQLSEVMFDVRPKVQVDLITGGVWVPIATALMADAGIKMAIFSPGIASILQSNYLALDKFLSELAARLLLETPQKTKGEDGDKLTIDTLEQLYFTPTVSAETVERAQSRIFAHSKTVEFSKRWNLPIYYQLRFGDCCTRLNKAIDLTTRGGWSSEVYTGDTTLAESLRNTVGFELSFFLELYDTLLSLWRPDVILRPLTNRFLRGAVQLVGRSIAFIRDGMDGKIKFGGPQSSENGSTGQPNGGVPLPSSRMPYSWGDSAPDVASVAWELAVLDTSLSHEYVSTICDALNTPSITQSDRAELRGVVSEIFSDTSSQIRPIVERAWNEIIVKLLVEKCSAPLGAVKGVVATYRMTNRPPPTQASPYVATILRPLKEFSRDFELRTPDHIGNKWKISILTVVTEKYGAAVEELIATVQRTESALQNRRARGRATSGGISDGDKVKLQLYLDFEAFCRDVEGVGVTPSSIEGISKLQELTQEAQKIQE
mmetsp:Transcript_14154/g.34069  ORF Transcript_14154/g.34069 Transcript_14154/m.34069 type:complete len:960 (-) Transcript_14154:55-2934(-)